jgi:P pilus assembly chaperone PapD
LFGAQSGALKNQGKEPFIMKIAKKKTKTKNQTPQKFVPNPPTLAFST